MQQFVPQGFAVVLFIFYVQVNLSDSFIKMEKGRVPKAVGRYNHHLVAMRRQIIGFIGKHTLHAA